VSDYENYRVLRWESFPATDFAPADVVIGQGSMTTSDIRAGATGFDEAYTIASNGNQILIPDHERARVRVYDAFPTTDGATADAVLGQATFAATVFNDDDQDGVSDAVPSAPKVGRSYEVWMARA
jgi:hypothetical protein